MGTKLRMMTFFHGSSMKETVLGLLEKGCMRDHKMKQIKNGLLRSVQLLFKEDFVVVDVFSTTIGTQKKPVQKEGEKKQDVKQLVLYWLQVKRN